MRYENYNMGDMVFNTKEDWTDEEKQEFLDTCPEGRDNSEKMDVLKQMLKDIEDGVLKTTKYKDIHFKSAESYIKNKMFLTLKREYYSDTKRVHIMIDGKVREINNAYRIKMLLEEMENVEGRFNYISGIYKEKEIRYKKENEAKTYVEENKERIKTSALASCWLTNVRLEVPTKVNRNDSWNDSICYYVSQNDFFNEYNRIITNQYDEIIINGTPITKEDAEHIIEVMKEVSDEVSKIIERCKAEMVIMRHKYEK